MRYLIRNRLAEAVGEGAAPLHRGKVGLLFGFWNPNVVHVKFTGKYDHNLLVDYMMNHHGFRKRDRECLDSGDWQSAHGWVTGVELEQGTGRGNPRAFQWYRHY